MHHIVNYEKLVHRHTHFSQASVPFLEQIIGAAHACLVSCGSLKVCEGPSGQRGWVPQRPLTHLHYG